MLLFPPQCDPRGPYLALPVLTAFLRQNGYDVVQKDVNAEAFDKLLTKENLERMHKMILGRLKELDGKQRLSYAEQKKYGQLGKIPLFAPYIIRNIEKAKSILRDKEEFYDLNKHNWGYDVVSRGLGIISAAYYPTVLSSHNYGMRYSAFSTKQVMEAIQDKEENVFLDFFERYTIPEIMREKPDLVGISIAEGHQIIAGLTLAHLIKKAGFYVTIGGTIYTKLIAEMRNNKELFSCADSFLVYEGEHALLALAQQLEANGDFSRVPNLIYRKGEQTCVNEPFFVEDVNSLPTPDFDGLSFELYLSPEKILPLSLSKGCYWRKCAFCEIHYSNTITGYPCHYRPRRTELVIEDIRRLSRKYDTRFFIFTDETVSPEAMRSLSDSLIANSLKIQWLCYARFEEALTLELCQLIAKAGCRKLLLGLESGCQRVLDLMEKGTRKETVEVILRNLYEAGVSFYLFCMIGFPTETKEEALETLDLILRNKEVIDTPGSFLEFVMIDFTNHCKVAQSPHLYGVTQIFRNEDDDLSIDALGFQAERGMNQLAAKEVLSNLIQDIDKVFSPWRFPSAEEYTLLYHFHHDTKPFISPVLGREVRDTEKSWFDHTPYIPDSIAIKSFRYNLESIIETVSTKEEEIERIRLEKGWLSRGEEIRRDVESKVAPLYPEKSYIVANAEGNNMALIYPSGKFLLALCNGNRTFMDIARRYSDAHRVALEEAARHCMSSFERLLNEGFVNYK